jgi:hypothetical protein
MTTLLDEIEAATSFANSVWAGSNYLIISLGDLGLLASAGISQVTFAGWNIEYLNTSGLSTRTHRIPIRYNAGTISLRGAVERNTSLYERFWTQQQYLKGNGALKPETIIIYTYGVGGVQQALPVSIVVAVGCVPVSYKHADADANGTTSLPLEELVLQPHDIYRVTGDVSRGVTRDIRGAFG